MVLTPESLVACRAVVREATVDETVMAYITALATEARAGAQHQVG